MNCVVVFTFWKCFTAGKGKVAFNVFSKCRYNFVLCAPVDIIIV